MTFSCSQAKWGLICSYFRHVSATHMAEILKTFLLHFTWGLHPKMYLHSFGLFLTKRKQKLNLLTKER